MSVLWHQSYAIGNWYLLLGFCYLREKGMETMPVLYQTSTHRLLTIPALGGCHSASQPKLLFHLHCSCYSYQFTAEKSLPTSVISSYQYGCETHCYSLLSPSLLCLDWPKPISLRLVLGFVLHVLIWLSLPRIISLLCCATCKNVSRWHVFLLLPSVLLPQRDTAVASELTQEQKAQSYMYPV